MSPSNLVYWFGVSAVPIATGSASVLATPEPGWSPGRNTKANELKGL